jgi:uncharacterized membrane protein (DUF485 family)
MRTFVAVAGETMKKMNIAVPDDTSAWTRACAGAAFVELKSQRFRLVRALTAIYLLCYLGLAVLCGSFPNAMGIKVLGPMNLGYALILGNYVVAWILALIYLRRSGNWHDVLAAAAIEEHTASLTAVTVLAP